MNASSSQVTQDPFEERDVVLVNQMQNTFTFFPLTVQQKKSLCLKVNIAPVISEIADLKKGIEMERLYQTKSISGDGNCFLRALSHVVSGIETNHRKIRLAVVKHMLAHSCRFLSSLRNGYISIEYYVKELRMKHVGILATELEIQTAADLFGTTIIPANSSPFGDNHHF